MARTTMTPEQKEWVEEVVKEQVVDYEALTNGPGAAAILASGIGSLALGVFTTLAEASPAVKAALNLYNPVGPLSGKTTAAVLVWLLAWGMLHLVWKDRTVPFGAVFAATLVLIVGGLIGTFPLFFEAFGH